MGQVQDTQISDLSSCSNVATRCGHIQYFEHCAKKTLPLTVLESSLQDLLPEIAKHLGPIEEYVFGILDEEGLLGGSLT